METLICLLVATGIVVAGFCLAFGISILLSLIE